MAYIEYNLQSSLAIWSIIYRYPSQRFCAYIPLQQRQQHLLEESDYTSTHSTPAANGDSLTGSRPLSTDELSYMPPAEPKGERESDLSQLYHFVKNSGTSLVEGIDDIKMPKWMPKDSTASTKAPKETLVTAPAPTPSVPSTPAADSQDSSASAEKPPLLDRILRFTGIEEH